MQNPVIVGVGQFTENIDEPNYKHLSIVELATEAVKRALHNTGGNVKLVLYAIDTVAAVRQFEASSSQFPAVFGKSNNFPRSVMKRLKYQPNNAILETVGGNTPQHLVNEFAKKIANREAECVLLLGSEALSTQRYLMSKGQKENWSETIEGSLEDRLHVFDLFGMLGEELTRHKNFRNTIPAYAMFENARRSVLGKSIPEYRNDIARLFSPFTKIAKENHYAARKAFYTPEDLANPTANNRLITDIYTRRVISFEIVNQAAAVLLMSEEKASQLNIPKSKWVYLHGHAHVEEQDVLHRKDLSKSPAAIAASKLALETSSKTMQDMSFIDLYSCFAIPVFNIADHFSLATDGSKELTVTGGLPFFGGPGNNYSMHAIATMVEKLRNSPQAFGFIGANGGFLSEYAVGIYSAIPTQFCEVDNEGLQKDIRSLPQSTVVKNPQGRAKIITYSLEYNRNGKPESMLIIGQIESGERFVAIIPEEDIISLKLFADGKVEAIGCVGNLSLDKEGRNVFCPSFSIKGTN